jgi:pimeloyl-ACP methyl ester carboxylesterase
MTQEQKKRRMDRLAGEEGWTRKARGAIGSHRSTAISLREVDRPRRYRIRQAASPPQAGDPSKSLTTPLPSQAPMVERVADLGNTKLWYWDTGEPGEAIVLLHPGSGSGESYPYQQPAFARAGYRVISYSRRGQNKSELGTDADTYFAADDLLNLMLYLKVEKFHVVGNALGGYIGLDLAISHPERTLSLVLACSMMGISEPEYTGTLQALRPKAFNDLPAELKELGPSYRAANPSGVAEWKRLHAQIGTRSPVRLRNKITWAALADLKVPTLLITGDADLWIPPSLLWKIGEKIPNSKIVIVSNSGHAVQWEQPEIFNSTVLDFIRANRPQA